VPEECPLCVKVRGQGVGPDELVWEFPRSIAFLGPWQYYRGYCVLVSRVHARELNDLSPDVSLQFFNEMRALARALEAAFRPRKLNYELLGNLVPHLHWHLFPRYEDDPGKLKPVWLAIDRAEHDERERQWLMSVSEGRGTRAQTIADIQGKLAEFIGSAP
jgi:diadenosine tetraphosphate (Ap4A) HIT family hydrolase